MKELKDAYEITSVSLENGKYIYECDRGEVTVKRFGEPWLKDLAGEKALIGLIHECADAKKALTDIKGNIEYMQAMQGDLIDPSDILRILEENE